MEEWNILFSFCYSNSSTRIRHGKYIKKQFIVWCDNFQTWSLLRHLAHSMVVFLCIKYSDLDLWTNVVLDLILTYAWWPLSSWSPKRQHHELLIELWVISSRDNKGDCCGFTTSVTINCGLIPITIRWKKTSRSYNQICWAFIMQISLPHDVHTP